MTQQKEEDNDHVRISAPITGFVDYNPQEQYLFNTWIKKVAATYESFGFTPLHLRPFERLKALQGESDTQKQIFELFRADTKQSTGLGLPFDRTVPLALWVAEHSGHLQKLVFPYKRYDLGLSFRGERPKTGRFRAFVQADVDVVGKNLGLSADVECMAAVLNALRSLNVGDFRVNVNHIKIVKSILKMHKIPFAEHAAVLRIIDKLDKITPEEASSELARTQGLVLSGEEIKALLASFLQKADLSQEGNYGEDAAEGLSDLRTMIDLFKIVGIDPKMFVFTPGMVRGLTYYTGVVFETLLVGKEQYGSIAGGGRYSRLVGDFSSSLNDVEGVGISLGLTRLFDVLCKTGMLIPQRATLANILVGVRSSELMASAYRLGEALRKRGFLVDMYSGAPKIKQALAHANAIGIPFAALVMDENAFVMKDLIHATQEEYATIDAALKFPGFAL